MNVPIGAPLVNLFKHFLNPRLAVQAREVQLEGVNESSVDSVCGLKFLA